MKLGSVKQHTQWIEGNEDDTSWEIGKFLLMATKCNPTVLECFLAPQVEPVSVVGTAIQKLFPHVWNSVDVRNAFVGYGLNQRKKFLDNHGIMHKDKTLRPNKYTVAYLRTLYQGWELLTTGTFTVRIRETQIGPILENWKNGIYSVGDVIELSTFWENRVEEAFLKEPNKKTNLDPINDLLLNIRKDYWHV